MIRQWLVAVVLVFGVLPLAAHAVARPGHKHEDLFGEEDILLGFKLGPELTGYTAIKTPTATIDVQSSMRAMAGAALEFVYGFPRFEIDLFWNIRGGVNTGENIYAMAIPMLVKLPWEIGPGLDLEFGAGYEPDFILSGPSPHRNTFQGLLGAIGLAVDLQDYVFSFQARYNYGLETLAEGVDGGKPRDFQMIGGLGWHF